MFNKDKDEYERWCRYGHERGWFDKTKDVVASWFGDEDAERRRRFDQEESRAEQFGTNGSFNRPVERSNNWRDDNQLGSNSRRTFDYGRPYQGSRPAYNDRLPSSRYFDEDRYPGNWGPPHQGRESEFLNAAGGSLTPWSTANERLTPLARTGRGRRGPKNYKRSDERILDDIHEQIDRHLDLDAREVIVDVKDGEVTLRGTVSDRADKRLIEEMAEDVFGVNNVQNLLRVNPDEFGEGRLGSTGSIMRTTPLAGNSPRLNSDK